MAEHIYLHIGAPKSGTTFLQTLLWANQDNLAAAGVLLPGRRKFDHNHVATVVRTDSPPEHSLKTWRRIEKQIREWPGSVILTNEWFSMASQEQAKRFIERLPGEVHIVFTARNLVNVAPAAWQEALKLGFSTPLDAFVSGMDTQEASRRWWWGTLDPAVVLPKWAASLPAKQIHIVTVPPRSLGPNVLWERFAQVCGIKPGVCNSEGAAVNESVGAESARLLQLIGPQLRQAIGADERHWSVPYKWLRDFLSHSILAPLGGSKIGLGEEQLAKLVHRSRVSASALEEAGFDVRGDLDELRYGNLANAVRPEELDDREVLPIALKVIPQLIARASQEALRADSAERRAMSLQKEMAKLRIEKKRLSPGLQLTRLRHNARRHFAALRNLSLNGSSNFRPRSRRR